MFSRHHRPIEKTTRARRRAERQFGACPRAVQPPGRQALGVALTGLARGGAFCFAHVMHWIRSCVFKVAVCLSVRRMTHAILEDASRQMREPKVLLKGKL